MRERYRTVSGLPADLLAETVLRSAVDHAIVTTDADGAITSWNEGAERILGWSEDEAVGRPVGIFFTPEDVASDRPGLEMRAARERGRAEDERWYLRRDGRRFWGSGMMMPLPGHAEESDASSRAGGFVKIFRDRTGEHGTPGGLDRLRALATRRAGTVGAYDYDALSDVLIADAVAGEMHGIPGDVVDDGLPTHEFLRHVDAADAERVGAAMARAVADGGDLDEVYRVGSGPTARWVHAQAAAQRDGDGRVARLSGIAQDVTEPRRRAAMQEAQLSFMDAARNIPHPAAIATLAAETIGRTLGASRVGHGDVDPDGDAVDIAADWAAEGHASLVGRRRYGDFGRFAPGLRDGRTLVVADARTHPDVSDPDALEALGVRSLVAVPLLEDGRLRAILFVSDAAPRVWTDDEVAFMSAIFDRTYAAIDRARWEAERDLMARELAHRMKNLLALAQVVVGQSLRGVAGLDGTRAAIGARLQALGEAQAVLSSGAKAGAEVASVVEAAFRPHRAMRARIHVGGGRVALGSDRVLGLTLALHELATNAVKHGALSGDDGTVSVEWSRDGDRFSLAWTERGGPPVAAPSRRGFGSTILERVVGGYFEGASRLEHDPAGLRFVLEGTV